MPSASSAARSGRARAKSAAARQLMRARPIFVGEVRSAAPTGGCSWTLSGGRYPRAAVQFSSKYAHIFAHSRSRNSRLRAPRARSRGLSRSRLRANRGASSQTMPSALPAGSGENIKSAAPAAAAGQCASSVPAGPEAACCAEVCHCKSRRFETSARQSAVQAAERAVQAAQGRRSSRSTKRPAPSAAP